jgi:aerobic carbon-monoxide dehydrogenase medium subunit
MLDRFIIHEPRSVAEASALLAAHGPEAAIYAGGTELLVVMKERLAHFPHLVNIKTIPGLAGISLATAGETIEIGPLATHRGIERSPLVRAHVPLLAELAAKVANVRVRAAGTIGGNLCFAEPHSDPATLLVAWGATLTLTSEEDARELPVEEFFLGMLETARRHEEVLTEIRVPILPPDAGSAYERFNIHERPTATIAVVLRLAAGEIVEARIVAGSVGPRPLRLPLAEAVLVGQRPVGALFASAAERARNEVEVTEDIFESGDYKRHLVRVLTERALMTAARRAMDTDHA